MSKTIKMTPGNAEAPRNQWYVIAFSDEVTRTPLSRKIMDDPIVLYRCEDGSPVALFDRCPHRGMPLSLGSKLIDDAIQCNYHGLEFGPDGNCRKVPSGGPVSRQMCVQTYPIVEIWQWLWIWPGDPEKADPSLIPDHGALGLTDPDMYSYPAILLDMRCNYLHAYENLLDATHISYLHHGFIDSGNVAAHPFREEIEGDKITAVRIFEDEEVHAYARASYGIKSDRVDRQLRLVALPPTICVIDERYLERGIEDPRELIVRLIVPITPSTHDSCHQFVAAVRMLPTDIEPLRAGLRGFLGEDQIALAVIQKLFDSLDDDRRDEVSVKSDNPTLRVRRVLERMIREERQTVQAAAE